MNEAPVIAQKTPYPIELKAGKTYYWCQCGRSQRQPFCDGSHAGTEFEPVPLTATQSETVYLCGCKRTKNQPFCDGTHQTL